MKQRLEFQLRIWNRVMMNYFRKEASIFEVTFKKIVQLKKTTKKDNKKVKGHQIDNVKSLSW